MTGSTIADAVLIGVLGLLIGSFLNVVIHRLPRMMERQWEAECRQYAQDAGLLAPAQQEAAAPAPFNLLTPRSRCRSRRPRSSAAAGSWASLRSARSRSSAWPPSW